MTTQKNSASPAVMPTFLSDVELNTVMDTGFLGIYAMTPELHSHAYFELLISINGEYRIDFTDGESIKMTPGKLCLIPPSCYHCTVGVSEKPEKLAVRFSYRQRSESAGAASLFASFDSTLSGIAEPICFSSSDICLLMQSIRLELMEEGLGSDTLVDSLLRQLYIRLIRRLSPGAPSGRRESPNPDDTNSRYYKIEIYLAEHYSEQITEEDLAETLSLSKRQVSRLLRSLFGMSFREKLIDTRLHKAAKLLTDTEIPIERISALVGYTSLSGFYTSFVKRYGISSSEYRRRKKQ